MQKGGAGVVLAAGMSSRMGTPKALLQHRDGRTFLEVACAVLREAGADPVVVVLGFHRQRLEERLPEGTQAVVNPQPELGQVRSMAIGLRAARGEGKEFALVSLVDHPAVASRTVRALAEAAAGEPGCLHVPVWRGSRGHPVAVPTSLAEALFEAPPGEGARDVFARLQVEVREHPVEDPGILIDVDTPEQLERWRRQIGEDTP